MISLDGFPAWLWADPTLPVPTLRRLASEGSLAKAMTVSNPTVTWPNHTTMVTGVSPEKHGVLFNGLLVRPGPNVPPRIDATAGKQAMVKVPTLYDVAFQNGLTTAHVAWVAIANSGTINWEFAEIPDPKNPVSRELVQAGVITDRELSGFRGLNIVTRDLLWTRAATHLLQSHQPNLLLLHLLTTDSINHRYEAGSLASMAAFGFVDAQVREVIRAIEDSGLKERTTVFVVTDHGFKAVQKIALPNVMLRKAGFIRATGPVVSSCDAYVMTQGGMAMVFVTDKGRRAELMPRLKEALGRLEGVDRVVEPSSYASLGLPSPEHHEGMGDLVLFPRDGYAFQSTTIGEQEVIPSGDSGYRGSHGYPASDPQLDGILIAWGNGIRKGKQLDRVVNVDIAPTVANLLGIRLPATEGKVLDMILTQPL